MSDKKKRMEEEKLKEEEELKEKQERMNQVKKYIAETKTQKRIGEEVYQDIIQKVKSFTDDKINEFKENDEREKKKLEEQIQDVQKRKEESTAASNELKDRLNQLKQKHQTGAIFNSGRGGPLPKIESPTTQRVIPAFNKVQKDKVQQKKTLSDSEFKQTKEISESDRKNDDEVRKANVKKMKEEREQKQQQKDLGDQFKAKMSGKKAIEAK